MGIILIITAIVALITVYDYYTTRKWQQITSELRNEVVFENRNQKYGAYQIRRNYNRNLILIFLGLASTFGASYAGLYVFTDNEHLVSKADIPTDETTETIDDIFKKSIELDLTKDDQKQTKAVNTIENLPPIVVDTDGQKTATQDDMENRNSSTTTAGDEEDDFRTVGQGIEDKSGTDDKKKSGDFDDNKIPDFVDIDATFPGGYTAMQSYLSKNLKYPDIAINLNIEGKAVIRFIVGADGAIENATIYKGIPDCPECNMEALRVIKKMPKWIPAKLNGKNTKSYFNLPISFKLKK